MRRKVHSSLRVSAAPVCEVIMDGLNQLNGGVPEEEEEESEDEEEDEEEEEDEDRDGVLEGGVAEEPEKGKEPRKAAAADLVRFILKYVL